MNEDKKTKTERLLRAARQAQEEYPDEVEFATFENGKGAVYASPEAYNRIINDLQAPTNETVKLFNIATDIEEITIKADCIQALVSMLAENLESTVNKNLEAIQAAYGIAYSIDDLAKQALRLSEQVYRESRKEKNS